MKKLINIFLLLALLPLSGCIDPIEFTGEGGDPLWVIYGNLKMGELESELTIRRTQPTGGPSENLASGVVKIINGSGAIREMVADENLIYRFEPTPDFQLEEGESYALEVELPDGKTFITEPQIMPAPPPPALGQTEILAQQVNVSAQFDFTNVSEPQYLRAIYEEVYSFPEITCSPVVGPKTCYFQRELPILFMPLADNNEGTIRDTVTADMFELLDFSDLLGGIWGKHYYNLYIHSIPKEAHNYWQRVNQISNAQGSIFDATPAVVQGNIFEKGNPENRILGYFEVAQVSVTRPSVTLLDFANAGFNFAPYCPVGVQATELEFGNFDNACCNCLLLENASLEKPDWF